MLIHAEPLREFVTQIFVQGGASQEDACTTADHLVLANLKGHDSHGVGMVPTYVRNLKSGFLDVAAHCEVTRDSGSVLLVDGQAGLGQVVGKEATNLLIDRTKMNGLACVGLKNAHHLGRIGTYGEMCGEAGLVSVHFVNVVGHTPRVAPWAGKEARLQTNPFCCTVPRDGQQPIVLDMATSAIALGKVNVAFNAGNTVPRGALRDAEGNPTTDPSVMYKEPIGTLNPFGEHKGYGLALMCELLAGALVGEWTMQSGNPRTGTVVNHMLMIALDPITFGGTAKFQAEVEETIEYMHSTKAAEGFDRVRIAGEPEQESFRVRSSEGIPLDATTWQAISRAAEQVGMSSNRIPSEAA